MRQKFSLVGRKVPRSSSERNRRTLLKLAPKLRKVKPARER